MASQPTRQTTMAVRSDTKAYALECEYYRGLADKALSQGNIFVLNGHRCSLKVVNNALSIQPGSATGEMREPTIFYRGMVPVGKIIILSDSGYISLDAFYWCHDQGISILMLDWKGNVVYSASPESRVDAALRRKQYAASGGQIALEIVHRKVITQYETVAKHPELRKRDKLLPLLESAEWELSRPSEKFLNVDFLRLYEGRLAVAYFDAFVGLSIKWGVPDAKKIPPHCSDCAFVGACRRLLAAPVRSCLGGDR